MFKKIASNTLAQLIAKFFGAGLTLLTTYFTIRLAGLPLYGDLTKILVMVAVGFTAIDFGLNAQGIRSASSAKDMHKHTKAILLTRLLLSCLVVVILNLVVYLLPGGYSSELKSVFWLGSLAIIFQGIYTSGNAWFQYQLSYWRSTVAVVIGSLSGTLLTLYFLQYSPTLSNLILANTLGYLAMAICSLFLLPPTIFSTLTRLKSQGDLIAGLLRRSLILGLILIASVLASKIDTIILGVFRLSSEVGEYGFAYRIFDVVLVLPAFLMNVVYPLSIRQSLAKGGTSLISKTTKYLGVISLFISVILWFGAPYLYLVKPGMDISISVLRILALTLPLFYLTSPLMWLLISQRRDKTVLGVYLGAAILNALLNLLFIPSFGAHAAAINTGLTELFIFLSLLYFSKNI